MEKQPLATLTSSAIFILILIACNSTAEKKDVEVIQKSPSEVKTVFVNGDSLHYLEAGKGETVILIHGTLGDYGYGCHM